MIRDILHLSIPDFPIALARTADPSLRGRPVAVAAGRSERALLHCVSAEARAEGVAEGMAVFRARRFCPALTLLPPDPQAVSRGTGALQEISAHFSPLLEPASPGSLFLDLTGSRRLLGPGRDAAARLDREIQKELRLTGSVGLAGNKLVSRIAAGFLPEPGICDVLRGSESGFIAPLPVSVLPGVGKVRESQLLKDLNLRRVGEIADLSLPQLRLAFGSFAPLLYQRARGIDPSPVRPPRRSPEVVEEAFLEREENDDLLLLAEACRLAEGCGIRLRKLGKGAGRILLTVTYADGRLEQRTAEPAAPLCRDLDLFAVVEELFRKACARRVRVKGLRLVCTKLFSESRQMDLFAPRATSFRREEELQEAMDDLRERFGREALHWGRTRLFP